jgi:hypothetical protein
LWNPNAAACWSLLFTPAFGAWLHTANWRALGRADRARASAIWAGVNFVFLAVNAASLVLPDNRSVELVFQCSGISLLLAWYFVIGREQVRYVSDTVGEDYVRRGWFRPIAVAAVAVAAYVGLLVAIAAITAPSGPEEIADYVRPRILAEWHKQPEFRDATIESIHLDQVGNTYRGYVDATFGGRPTRMILTVIDEGDNLSWEVRPETDRGP